MIFGTDQFIIDSSTGIRYQMCLVDVTMPNGTERRITILADEGDGYFLQVVGCGPMRRADEVNCDMWYDRQNKEGFLFPVGTLFIVKETEL